MVIAKSKKVKPHTMNTNTIKNMDYNWTPGPELPNNQETGIARAIFLPHANSLPFEERRVTLEQPVKIGRNVYRAAPTPSNTIFECRVLSRHHATLYYDKGHFYLVDNQSSNGTFINNNRCSISKDQEPHEVFSGDVVQFGISVVENAVNSEKNTFPPVVALLKLYHPDGKEAKLSFNPTMTTPLHLKELYQLNNFVQEAIQREESLEARVRTLRECVERTRASAHAAWEQFVGEQRLLMRVRTLESMLASGKQPESQHVAQLLDDKQNYQEVAQENLRAAHEQRLILEESLERRSREVAALQQHNCALRLAANNALVELQKLAARCERKMCAARLAIATAEERETQVRSHLPLAYSVQNGEAKMLVVSTDSNVNGSDTRRGVLEDAVRELPDYIKLLLPQHLLNKVGFKTVTADGKQAKEFELILKKNNIYDTESREKQDEEDMGVGGSGEEKSPSELTADLCTDDEKQSRLNHDTTDVECSSPIDGELVADNNANSTYSESSNREESPNKGSVEYANILLRVMAGLNEEILTLRERLSAASQEADQLRGVRDELLAAGTELHSEPRPETDTTVEPADAAAYSARIEELQALLNRSSAAEKANLAEIQRLSSSTTELQSELSSRPTREEYELLTAHLQQLQAAHDDHETLTLRSVTEDKATETSRSLEDLRVTTDTEVIDPGKLSAEIDEMFRLDYEDDEETTDSAATEVMTSRKDDEPDYIKLEDSARLQETLSNGSLHALEEELVRAKEMWAEASAEKARLASQLATLQSKPRLTPAYAMTIMLPVLAALFYWLMLPQLS